MTLDQLIAENKRLMEYINELEEERRLWLAGQYWQLEHNERGAGRKPKVTESIKAKILEYRAQGMTFREISEKTGLSLGAVHGACH